MQTWNEFYTEQQLNENLMSWTNTIFSKMGQMIPGVTPQEKADNALDMVNLALDAAGIADPSGVADGTNAAIYAIRAISAKEPDAMKRHMLDALISAVSAIPFGDLAKLLKARKMKTGAKTVAQIGRPLRTAAHGMRQDRFDSQMGQMLPAWGVR